MGLYSRKTQDYSSLKNLFPEEIKFFICFFREQADFSCADPLNT